MAVFSFNIKYAMSASGCCNGTSGICYANTEDIAVGVTIYENSGLTQGWNNSWYVLFENDINPYAISLISAGYLHNISSYECLTSNLQIYLQPDLEKIFYCRSPIVYRYINCYSTRTYTFNFYIGTTDTPTVIYATINRIPDTKLGITVDVSNLLRNYLKNNLSYTGTNLIYFKAVMLEYDNLALIGTSTSNVAMAMLGYTDYSSGGTFNVSPVGNYLMNTQPQNTNYPLPVGNYTYYLNFRVVETETPNYNNYVVYFTPIACPETSYSVEMAPEVATIPFGFYNFNPPLTNDIDVTKPITIVFKYYTDILSTYTFVPTTCTGYEVITVNFLNKYGVWEVFFLQGRMDESSMVEYDIYKHNKVNYGTMLYDTQYGSYHKTNIQSRKKYIMNTGWLYDVQNTKLEEMLLSEYILIDNLPYILYDKEIRYKTNRNDKMVNYVLTFDRAYDTINNII